MNKQDIEKLKANEKAFQFWPEEWQKWAEENFAEFKQVAGQYKIGRLFQPSIAYQLRADYDLREEKHWFFNNNNNELYKPHNASLFKGDEFWMEVPANLVDYVRECLKRDDIKEFELRPLVYGENADWIDAHHPSSPAASGDVFMLAGCLRFVRKKKAGWVEYEIVKRSGIPIVADFRGQDSTLSKTIAYAIDHGMCPLFAYKGHRGWSTMMNHSCNDTPLTLVKMRVWEGDR